MSSLLDKFTTLDPFFPQQLHLHHYHLQHQTKRKEWSFIKARVVVVVAILPTVSFDFLGAGVALPKTHLQHAEATMTQLDSWEAYLPHHCCCSLLANLLQVFATVLQSAMVKLDLLVRFEC